MTTKEKRAKLASLYEQTQQLWKEIEAEESRCEHRWDESIYDPETRKEPSSFGLVGMGSDVWTQPDGWHEVTVPRWSRTCLDCGKVEYTTTQKPVAFAPVFR